MMQRLMRMRHAQCSKFLALAASLSVLGCSAGSGSVSGTVKYKGQVLGSGVVVFIGADGKPLGSVIGPEGGYSLALVPAGKYTVTVETPPPFRAQQMRSVGGRDNMNIAQAMAKNLKDKGHVLPSTAPPEGKYVPVPERYKDRQKSGLSFEVTGGTNTIDLDLVD
jgi:hypothetical protein